MADVPSVDLLVTSHASPTYHGRDVFAPAAAQLAHGADVDALGSPAPAPIILRTPEPHRAPTGELLGAVIAIDHFGNAITNLVGMRGGQIITNGREITLRRTYAELEPGEAGAVVGSTGLIEIVVREGRANEALGLARGTPVSLR
jgi:S-adenosylmethionine hydrolase